MSAQYQFVEDEEDYEANNQIEASQAFVIKRAATIPPVCQSLLIVATDGPGLIAEHIISLSVSIGTIDVCGKTIASLYLTKDDTTLLVQFDNKIILDECCSCSIVAAIVDLCKPDVTCVLSCSANLDTSSSMRTLLTSDATWSSNARCVELHTTALASFRIDNPLPSNGYSGIHAAVLAACEARGLAGISFVAQKKGRLAVEVARAYEALSPLLSKILSVQLIIPVRGVSQKYVGPQDQLTTRTGNLYT
jgi:hypothetical protein